VTPGGPGTWMYYEEGLMRVSDEGGPYQTRGVGVPVAPGGPGDLDVLRRGSHDTVSDFGGSSRTRVVGVPVAPGGPGDLDVLRRGSHARVCPTLVRPPGPVWWGSRWPLEVRGTWMYYKGESVRLWCVLPDPCGGGPSGPWRSGGPECITNEVSRQRVSDFGASSQTRVVGVPVAPGGPGDLDVLRMGSNTRESIRLWCVLPDPCGGGSWCPWIK